MVNEPSYIAAGGTEHGYKNFSSGLGFLLTYDTRDIPANAYSGTYLDFRGMMYNKRSAVIIIFIDWKSITANTKQ